MISLPLSHELFHLIFSPRPAEVKRAAGWASSSQPRSNPPCCSSAQHLRSLGKLLRVPLTHEGALLHPPRGAASLGQPDGFMHIFSAEKHCGKSPSLLRGSSQGAKDPRGSCSALKLPEVVTGLVLGANSASQLSTSPCRHSAVTFLPAVISEKHNKKLVPAWVLT